MPDRTPNIAVVGSCNMDLVVRTPRIPVTGETVLGSDFATLPGGKGANQAVAAARLGGRVHFVARLGRDVFGDALLTNLQTAGVNTDHVSRSETAPSGTAMIMVDDAGRNIIAVAPGSNGELAPEHVDAAADTLAACDCVVLQLETPMATVEHAIALAHARGIPVILNPAPAAKLSPDLLARVTVLTPNETEAALLTGIEVTGLGSAETASGALLEMGVANVVITLGAEGALLASPGRMLHVPAREVEAVDTVAAGDAFTGALAWAMAGGRDLADAAVFARDVAALSVTRVGAQPSMPTLEEVEALVQE